MSSEPVFALWDYCIILCKYQQ